MQLVSVALEIVVQIEVGLEGVLGSLEALGQVVQEFLALGGQGAVVRLLEPVS